MNLQLLKVELTSDPEAVGYAPLVALSDWRGVRDVVNLPRSATVQETSIAPTRLRSQMVAGEYLILTDKQRELVRFYLSGDGQIDVSPGTPIRAALGAAFPSGSTTRANWLAVLSTTTGSRAEVLFGVGARVRWNDCRDAVRRP